MYYNNNNNYYYYLNNSNNNMGLKSNIGHLGLLAQTCQRYSNEFDQIIQSTKSKKENSSRKSNNNCSILPSILTSPQSSISHSSSSYSSSLCSTLSSSSSTNKHSENNNKLSDELAKKKLKLEKLNKKLDKKLELIKQTKLNMKKKSFRPLNNSEKRTQINKNVTTTNLPLIHSSTSSAHFNEQDSLDKFNQTKSFFENLLIFSNNNMNNNNGFNKAKRFNPYDIHHSNQHNHQRNNLNNHIFPNLITNNNMFSPALYK